MTKASAPGKIILFGEHAVVYGRPAIAIPVRQVYAEATIEPHTDERVIIDAVDVARQHDLDSAPAGDPLATIIRLTCARLDATPSHFSVRIHSTIPIASGLGSGAAVSVAIARALSRYLGAELPPDEISALAYQVEKLHHGTPSGVDNSVIAFERPVYFVRDRKIESFRVAQPFLLAIADTGIAAPTRIAVGDVRRGWEKDRARFESLFDKMGVIADKARKAIETGQVERLRHLMNANHILLREIGVSSPDIERLILAAKTAGAHGAKLSGAGRGGNIIAWVNEVTQDKVERALLKAGAKRVIISRIETEF